jgi:hypothetical protein
LGLIIHERVERTNKPPNPVITDVVAPDGEKPPSKFDAARCCSDDMGVVKLSDRKSGAPDPIMSLGFIERCFGSESWHIHFSAPLALTGIRH